MKKSIVIFMVLLMVTSVWADESDHPMSRITGENIELLTKGHSIAGKVGSKIIFGDVSTDGHKESTLIMKDDHGVIQTKFQNTAGSWGGVLANDQRTKTVKFISLDREAAVYNIAVGGKNYKVRVEAEDFKDNHFIKPTYILELDGKEIAAKMHEGQACYMFSLHLIFMIFGTYLF